MYGEVVSITVDKKNGHLLKEMVNYKVLIRKIFKQLIYEEINTENAVILGQYKLLNWQVCMLPFAN